MIIEKSIDLGAYKFSILIQSKSVHAHAAMTDQKDFIIKEVELLENAIRVIIRQHQEKVIT